MCPGTTQMANARDGACPNLTATSPGADNSWTSLPNLQVTDRSYFVYASSGQVAYSPRSYAHRALCK